VNTQKLLKKIAPMLPSGETALAATKATPRGAAHEAILGGAGAVAGGSVSAGLAGAGSVLGSAVGATAGDAGRSERAEADLDVGSASQILLVVTDVSLLLFALSALGRPSEITARLERSRISTVASGETSLFGQKMAEIVITTDAGAEAGFGIAKVHRKQGDAVLAALG